MQSVRLFVAGDGTVWVLSKCRDCGEVDKHLISEAMLTPISCKRCGHLMDMKGATFEAVESASNSPT
jgi:hypothetical protein